MYLLCPGRAYHIGILDVGLPFPASVLSSAGREMDSDPSPETNTTQDYKESQYVRAGRPSCYCFHFTGDEMEAQRG